MVRVDRWQGMLAAGAMAAAMVASPAWAQKNSGPLLPTYQPPVRTAPPYQAPPYQAPPYQAPAYPAPPRTAPPPAASGNNPEAARLAQTLPIDPQTAALVNQEPADPRATERRLGLREPRGPATDMRGRRPSPREIVDALAPR